MADTSDYDVMNMTYEYDVMENGSYLQDEPVTSSRLLEDYLQELMFILRWVFNTTLNALINVSMCLFQWRFTSNVRQLNGTRIDL